MVMPKTMGRARPVLGACDLDPQHRTASERSFTAAATT